MKTKMLFVAFAAMMIAVSSCKKNNIEESIQSENYSSVSDFFSKNGVQTQTFAINATNGGTIVGNQGTRITFPAHAFQDASGNVVNGNVNIKLREIYKASDMLLTDMPTMSYDQPLKSGGEFSLTVWQSNQQLGMAPGKSYTARMPADTIADPNMIAYAGTDSNNKVNWVPLDTTAADSSYYYYSPYYGTCYDSASTYIWTSNWLGWANCDHPCFNATSTNLTLHGTDARITYGTQVFLIFDGTIVEIYTTISDDFIYYYAPLGFNGTLVAVGIKDGNLYSSFQPITIGNNQTVNFTLTQTTTANFETALDALN